MDLPEVAIKCLVGAILLKVNGPAKLNGLFCFLCK